MDKTPLHRKRGTCQSAPTNRIWVLHSTPFLKSTQIKETIMMRSMLFQQECLQNVLIVVEGNIRVVWRPYNDIALLLVETEMGTPLPVAVTLARMNSKAHCP